jgi:hypothetical protein
LRLSLRLGAIYDLLLAGTVLLAGRSLFNLLGIPLPEPYFYLPLATLPLILLPVLYLAAARAGDCDPFRAPVLWARGGGGGVILMIALLEAPTGMGLLVAIGIVDLLWAGIHGALWRR